MPTVNYQDDRITFPDFMSGEEISDVLGALYASTQAVGEFAATLATGAVAEPIAGLTGLVTGDANAVQGMQERLTYQPRTRAGQMAMQSIAKDVSNLSQETGLDHVSGYWRDRVVPALQEQAGPIAGSILAAGGLAALTAISEISPQGRTARTASRFGPNAQEGAVRLYHGTKNEVEGGLSPSASGELGPGIYVTKKGNQASEYARESYGGRYKDGANVQILDVGDNDLKPINKEDWLNRRSEIMNQLREDNGGEWLGEFKTQAEQTIVDEIKAEGYKGMYLNNPLDTDSMMYDQGVVFPESKKITAYHGSPHDFDEFKMSQIGTGEGAQAYGHGLYFAESEDVAKGYRDQLSQASIKINGESFKDSLGMSEGIQDGLNGGQLISRMQDQAIMRSNNMEDLAAYKGFTNKIEKVKSLLPKINGSYDMRPLKDLDEVEFDGSMYQVEIDANPDEFLDWDKPLSEQGEVYERAKRAIPIIGEDPDLDLKDVLDNFDDKSSLEISETLKNEGIKGIKYKDGFSRGADGGTSNYVVFDDRLITISKKYGISIPAAAAMLGIDDGYEEQTELDGI